LQSRKNKRLKSCDDPLKRQGLYSELAKNTLLLSRKRETNNRRRRLPPCRSAGPAERGSPRAYGTKKRHCRRLSRSRDTSSQPSSPRSIPRFLHGVRRRPPTFSTAAGEGPSSRCSMRKNCWASSDFAGNASTSPSATSPETIARNVLLDFARQAPHKLWGRARVIEDDPRCSRA